MEIIFEFCPQKDITIYELAMIVRNVIGGLNHDINMPFIKFPGKCNPSLEIFLAMSEIQRHFKLIECDQNDPEVE